MSDNSQTPIRIDHHDLYSPQVNEFVEMQQALRRDTGPLDPQPLLIRVIYSSWFYLSIASGLGAFLGWAALEPFFDDAELFVATARLCWWPSSALSRGRCRHWAVPRGRRRHHVPQSVAGGLCGLVGLGVGFGGGLLAIFPAGFILSIVDQLAVGSSWDLRSRRHAGRILPVDAMMGRAAFWAIAAIPAGLGQGIALREKKVIFNGMVGGVLGGLLGGLLFDPICLLLRNRSRATRQPRHRFHDHRPLGRAFSSAWSKAGRRPPGC